MAKKAIQDRILPEAPAPVRSASKPKAPASAKARGAGAFFSGGDYLRRVGDLKGIRDVQKEFGPRPKQTAYKKYTSSVGPFNRGPVPGGQGTVGLTHVRFTPTANAPKATVGGVYSDVNARMMAHNKKLAAEAAAKKQAAAPTKSGGSFGQAFAAARKAGQSTFSFGGKSYTTAMKGESRPSGAKKTTGTTRTATGSQAPSSFGKAFASARAAGKSTFSFGGKSYTTAMKGGGGGGKASPASARANSSSRSTKTSSRGDVGAGRRGGGR